MSVSPGDEPLLAGLCAEIHNSRRIKFARQSGKDRSSIIVRWPPSGVWEPLQRDIDRAADVFEVQPSLLLKALDNMTLPVIR